MRRAQRRNLLASILAVLIISLGSFSAVVTAKWTPRLGLDLAGGLSVVYQAEHHVSASDLAETADILNNRVNGLGVSGAQVETTGNNEITVAIPGLKDPAEVLKAIGQTARISFRPVLCYAPPYLPAKSTQRQECRGGGTRSVAGLVSGFVPTRLVERDRVLDQRTRRLLRRGRRTPRWRPIRPVRRTLRTPSYCKRGWPVRPSGPLPRRAGRAQRNCGQDRFGSAEPYRAMGGRHHPDRFGFERLEPDDPALLPRDHRDRTRRCRPVGADHATHPRHVVLVRGPRRDLRRLHPAECAEPGHSPAVRLAPGRRSSN